MTPRPRESAAGTLKALSLDESFCAGRGLLVPERNLGPAGNHMFTWSPSYKTDATNDWGDTLNFEPTTSRRAA